MLREPEPTTQAVLFVFAHYDDEFFARPSITREFSYGHRVVCLYTTDAAAYGVSSDVRLQESINALAECGVSASNIISLGASCAIRDGSSHEQLFLMLAEIERATQGLSICKVFTLAWEGGHVDHDAVHLVSAALARRLKVPLYEYSAYNSFALPGPFFRCLTPLTIDDRSECRAVGFWEGLCWLYSSRHYRSQLGTFMGLLPLCLFPILVRRKDLLKRVVELDYRRPPHTGPLLYEKRFKVPFTEFSKHAIEFINRNLS